MHDWMNDGAMRGCAADEHSLGDAATFQTSSKTYGRIDQYALVRELGGGGFGTVYLARDTVAGIDVAVKGLPPLVKNNADELERIRENFALVSRLHHPNIAAALHLHPVRDAQYANETVRQALRVLPGDTLMVMAYAPGVTLNKWRKQFATGKVPIEQAVEVCRQIAMALDYAHGEKVVHRDVKPSNVMVETREEGDRDNNPRVIVRVLDFGLAAEIRSSMSRVSQEKGDTSGTRPYMAPEQWAGKKQDGRTDQYSLAALFYELVSGAVPFASAFDTGDPVIMTNAAKAEKPDPLPELTRAQNAALLRGLAKEPAERFANCTEFVATLGGRAPAEHSLGGRWSPRVPNGRKAVFGLAAAAVVVLASMLVTRSIQSRNARLAAERAAAEQVAKLDVAQRKKSADLKGAAEAALASGDLEAAGSKIAELEGLGGTCVGTSDLRKRYEAKAGEREANKRYAAASLAREKALKLDRGQGFGEKLDALEMTWREAEAARQGQGWGQALSGYDAVLAACKSLTEQETPRQCAKAQREVAEKAKREAEQTKASNDAKNLYADGEQASSQASEAFEKCDFASASNLWQKSVFSYSEANKRALVVQAYHKGKSEYESAVAANSVMLEKNGGPKWSEVKEVAQRAACETDLTAAAETYHHARSLIRDALREAEQRESARSVSSVEVSNDTGGSEPLFPLFGLTIGRTSREELALKGEKSPEFDFFKTNGLDFWCSGESYFDHMYITHNEKEWPQAWLSNGFRTEMSYDQWISVLKKYAFVIRIEKEPKVDTNEGKPSFSAAIIAQKKDAIPYEIELDFKYSDKTRTDEEGTLYSIDVRAIPELAGTRAVVVPDIQKRTRRVNLGGGAEMEMVWCPSGTFLMGRRASDDSDKERRPHRVTLTKGFWIGKNEVTQKQWSDVMGANPSANKGDDSPVENVSWVMCQEFIKRINAHVSLGRFRLPSEAEWEYACRAGTEGSFAGILEEMGWYAGNSEKHTHAVGQKLPNAWGLYDMHGNVQEWCQDWFGEYPVGPETDPTGPSSGTDRVLRGGTYNWCAGAESADARDKCFPAAEFDYSGVRLVMDGAGPD